MEKRNKYIVGERMLEARSILGLKQAEVGRRVGVRTAQISAWERSRAVPHAANLLRLANVLEVSVDHLLGNGEVPSPEFRIREQTQPYGDIPGARTVKRPDTRIPVLGSVQAGLTSPSRTVLTCPHCGKGIEIEGRRRE
jgi:transcriptional regulator with XRE-family HTH domain